MMQNRTVKDNYYRMIQIKKDYQHLSTLKQDFCQ